MSAPGSAAEWALALFHVSPMKQAKWRAIRAMVGDVGGRRCLDIGGDNGVISLLLRCEGGEWASADLGEEAVAAIRAVVGSDVHRLEERRAPFADGVFDLVVIVDCLEHVHDDEAFLREMARILRPGGRLIVNVPHARNGWLRWLRQRLGQTDERHGHVRPGYTVEGLAALLRDRFRLTRQGTYAKDCSELVDMLIRWASEWMKGEAAMTSPKGTVVTMGDLTRHRRLFRIYRWIYPVLWLASRCDVLLVGRDGYMLIAEAVVTP